MTNIYKPGHNRKPVTALGYFPQKVALECIEQEEIDSYVNGKLRASDLREVVKFVNLFREGAVLKVTLRRKSFTGTLLGFRRHERRGWIMGVLMNKDGVVKDITIDPMGYEAKELMETMYDPQSGIVCFVTPYQSILQISKAA